MKLIACDLDGTLLDDQKRPDPYLKELLPQLNERGIQFTIVSGRNEEIMDQYVDYYDCHLPYVTNNGGNIYKDHVCIENDCIPSSYNTAYLRALYERGVAFRAYAVEGFYAYSATDFFTKRMASVIHLMKPYDPLEDQSQYHFYKITADFQDHPEELEGFQEFVRRELPEMSFLKAENYVYCANSKTATKGLALKKVCGMLGISMEEVIAFGDNATDLSMLETAGMGVAVGNSSEDIKKRCDHVCGDNNHHGVSLFLKEYFHLQ